MMKLLELLVLLVVFQFIKASRHHRYRYRNDLSQQQSCIRECRHRSGYRGRQRCIVDCVCRDDPCENVICENGGSCVEDSQTGQGVCECFGNYSGRYCEISPCEPLLCPYCFHGGNCTVSTEGVAECDCLEGFSGERCSSSLCSTGYDCGPGTCFFSNRLVQCACPPGFYGDRCENDPCTPVDCLHGNCVYNESTGFAKCICNGDYTGSLCEISPCDGNPCFGNGNCSVIDNEANCICFGGYTGYFCHISPCEGMNCGQEQCVVDENLNGACCPDTTAPTTTIALG